MKGALAVAVLLAFALAAPARTTLLDVLPRGVTVFDLPVRIDVPTRISAAVEIKPTRLRLASNGRDVTARVEFTSGFTADGVDLGSVRLCLGTEPCGDGVGAESARARGEVLTVTFERAAVLALLPESADTVNLAVSGLIGPTAIVFAGSDSVEVLGGNDTAAASADRVEED